jgi:opacity protein-like surface antigen
MNKPLAALLLASCLFGTRAGAATVTLKDGSRLRGAISGQTADGFELATPDGTLHVSQSRVAAIDYSDEAAPAPAASPAEGKGRQLLSLAIGFDAPVNGVNFRSIPGGGTASNGDLGVQYGAQYVRFVTPRLGLGFDFDYFDRSDTISPGLFPAATSSVGGDTLLLLGIVRYTLADGGWLRPFVLAGAGGARNSTTIDVRASKWADTGTHETRRLVDDTAWAPAVSARAGVDFDIDAIRPGVFTVEAGWTGLASERYGSTPQGQAQGVGGVSGPLNIVTFTARYGWRF